MKHYNIMNEFLAKFQQLKIRLLLTKYFIVYKLNGYQKQYKMQFLRNILMNIEVRGWRLGMKLGAVGKELSNVFAWNVNILVTCWISEFGVHSKLPPTFEPSWSQSCSVSGGAEKVNRLLRSERTKSDPGTKSGSDTLGPAADAATWNVSSGKLSFLRAW